MLFITAKPVPTPQRKDAKSIQKSVVLIASIIVWSSPIDGRGRLISTTGSTFSSDAGAAISGWLFWLRRVSVIRPSMSELGFEPDRLKSCSMK